MSSAVSPDIAPDDSMLVLAAAAGDADALGAIYDRYAGPLLGFCHSLLRRQSEAEDCLRDTFVTAAARLPQLRDPSLLRAWLFALARHECLIRLEARASEPPAAAPIAAAPAELAPLTDPLAAEPIADDLFTEPIDDATPVSRPEPIDVDLIGVAPTEVAPIDLFDDPNAELLPYAAALPLELAERQQLADFEVAAAIGVPRANAPTIIARARRRAGRAGGPMLLGEGRAFAAETVALRAGVLAAAIDPVGHGHPAAISRGSADWKSGWPPPDPFFIGTDRRRWGAPLAVLAVLLLAIGAVFGLLSVTGGGHSASRTTTIANGSTSVVASSGGVEAAATSVAAPVPGNTSGVAIVPPTPSQVPTSTAPPTDATATSASSPPNGMWTVTVRTSLLKITITAGRAKANCAAGNVCAFSVPAGLPVTIADSNNGPATVLGTDSFSAPPSCASARGSCTFGLTSNVSIVLTTTLVRRNG